ncbi:stage V sporulation protein AB [Sporanaerobium hydrogeniformans]|uniref:Stage V sporulation protein AB n=1 Tax=Sporanaerobium hydrogeniformans TaxID=3072179 RepID=A0AC61DEP5_9FIRM|nr:stage V sporulation protein AB [Sporanaerobium hydrogeniformans]PHV71656.1 stage V sporulation protein AB [Sporanaerobium hydrogeniformans]
MKEGFILILRILLGFGTGLFISGGVVAFISIIGIVPIMAHRTGTKHYMFYYETAIMIGAVLGSIFAIWEPYVPLGKMIISILAFGYGIFLGVLIIALAEVLDVFPITNRIIQLKKGIYFVVFAIALGKLVGSLCYYFYPIFLEII